jgi:hypothetical protein
LPAAGCAPRSGPDGYVAATLAVVFFPPDDPAMGLLSTLLVFGAAFVVRPIGAIFFGRLGDRKGRRPSLIASVTLMGIAGFVTGLLPGYAQIGIWAPILLVLMRILQGFSTGGEIGGAPQATSGNGRRPSAARCTFRSSPASPSSARASPPVSLPWSRSRWPARPWRPAARITDARHVNCWSTRLANGWCR